MTSVAVVLAMLLVTLVPVMDAEAASDRAVLYDGGNGETEWVDAGTGTYQQVITDALKELGHTASFEGGITVDGKDEVTIGTTTTSWRIYVWDSAWKDVTDTLDLGQSFSGYVAIGFYPEGIAPVETPDYRNSWTMVRGDALNTGHQTSSTEPVDTSLAWDYTYGPSYVNSAILVAGPYAYVNTGGNYTSEGPLPALYCYERSTGKEMWKFEYPIGTGYETNTGVIYGDSYYLPASNGHIYKIPLTGPGEDNSAVTSVEITNVSDHDLIGMLYAAGPSSIVYDSGMLYFGSCGGYVYCMDTDLNIVWKSPVDACNYYMPGTVYDGKFYIGALDGCMYTFDQVTGKKLACDEVFTITTGSSNKVYGSANTPVIIGDIMMLSFNDGRGMNTVYGGVAAYEITDSGLKLLFKNEDIGVGSSMVLPVNTPEFQGIYLMTNSGMEKVSVSGTVTTLGDYGESFKAPLVLVNDEVIYANSYDKDGHVFALDLQGNVLGKISQTGLISNFSMCPVTYIDGALYTGTDGGVMAWNAYFDSTMVPEEASPGISGWVVALAVLILAAALFVAYLFHLKKTQDMPPMAYIRSQLKNASGFNNDRTSKVKKNKRRLLTVIVIGLICGFFLFLASLAYGPSGNYGLFESFGLFVDGLKNTIAGVPLTYDQTIVFDSRGSRAVAAMAVGFGLSISGAIYQAIIRNPMVDPYIMGVSAGAGVAAVAAIAFNFTFFGLLDSVTYATPIVAMIGGVVAFGATMLLAEKSGGSSVNYVLSGVIIGLVFSAIQTLMLSMAGDKLNSAMNWLFGSFANISWDQAILVLIPALALSLVPMVWAKEFNLVLLGEDQARQMGLDVRRFNRWMLILASVLASICVAFVGIIGFVGLVVPHLCRMILGGDHRLVMPASIVVGAALMLAADLFSKMILIPMELPVGAITTVIGAPVFAYLLIKKGRMYDG